MTFSLDQYHPNISLSQHATNSPSGSTILINYVKDYPVTASLHLVGDSKPNEAQAGRLIPKSMDKFFTRIANDKSLGLDLTLPLKIVPENSPETHKLNMVPFLFTVSNGKGKCSGGCMALLDYISNQGMIWNKGIIWNQEGAKGWNEKENIILRDPNFEQ